MRSNIVSKLTIVVVALAAAGCSPGTTNMTPLGDVRKVPIEGHDYFTHYKGGIIHSESCTNAACVPVTPGVTWTKMPPGEVGEVLVMTESFAIIDGRYTTNVTFTGLTNNNITNISIYHAKQP